MKLKITQSVICACIALSMLVQPSVSFAAGTKEEEPKEKKETKKTGRKKATATTSRNNSSVRIYPDILKRVMHVVAKDNDGEDVDFFVFDMEGAIIKHYKMKPGSHEQLAGLERGKYVFSVFSGDVETATGNFDIR